LRGSTGGDWVIDVPCVPNPVIAPHSAEKSRVLASFDPSYVRSFLM